MSAPPIELPAELETFTHDEVRAWIRALCDRLRVSQTHLAKRASIAPTTINRFMKTEWTGGLNLRTIDKIERAASCIKLEQAGITIPTAAPAASGTSIPAASLEQRAIDVRRAALHAIEIRQGDAVVTVLDCFVDDLVAALQRARAAR